MPPPIARSRATRNRTRRRLPRIVDLLTHHFLHLGPQLLHDASDVVGDIALDHPRPRQRDGLVELHASRPRRHQHDAVAQADRLAHVVRHEDDGLSGRAPDLGQLDVQDVARLRVERGERLVHEQHARIGRQRPSERHALAHPARQLVHVGVGEAPQVHLLEEGLGARGALVLVADAGELEAEVDVLARRQPREERRVLEHDAALGPGRVDDLAVERDASRVGALEPGDEVEQRRLAAARRAEQADELPFVDGERHIGRARGGCRAAT